MTLMLTVDAIAQSCPNVGRSVARFQRRLEMIVGGVIGFPKTVPVLIVDQEMSWWKKISMISFPTVSGFHWCFETFSQPRCFFSRPYKWTKVLWESNKLFTVPEAQGAICPIVSSWKNSCRNICPVKRRNVPLNKYLNFLCSHTLP